MKAILLDAYRLGIFDDSPLEGVKPPQCSPECAVIPSVSQLREIRTAGSDSFLLIADLMSGCGMRNGEAAAVNMNNIVADDVYRITEQVNQTTRQYGRLKHRRAGEYRDVPLPVRVKETIEWYADRYGTVDGYLLWHSMDPGKSFPYYYLDTRWKRIKGAGEVDIPEGMVIYGFRHFFASNCLSNGIPITDVAEWMGHSSIDVTFKTYRHLMPGSIGKAAKLLDAVLAG
ncbi:tyrosine-type recombinase/integrase [Streptomyces mirabilis]|uniref:tyrosine-type recombinase/integrase n=1 Tax=Streptomyces mirabilis TaxID=68239 RepID=UPI0036A0129A